METGASNRSTPPALRALAVVCAAALLAFAATGCQTRPKLQGRVVLGEISYVVVVDANDPRLTEEGVGVSAAMVRLETDPGRLRREIVGEYPSDPMGNFAIPLDGMGSRILMYDVGVTGRKAGYSTAFVTMRLPPASKRLLIMLAPGPDTFRDPYESDPLRDFERHR